MTDAEAVTQTDLVPLAALLDDAARSRHEVDRLTLTHPIDLADAYAIQKLSIRRRLERGEKLIGVKMGFTSLAKMEQMGVNESIWGRLTDAMTLTNGGELSLSRFIHPKAEPEVAFLLNKPLAGVVTEAEALDAIEAVAAAIEIIDSRFLNFKFTHNDVVADNCSSSGYVLGAWQSLRDLSDRAVSLSVDGVETQVGSTAAILGDPLKSLIAAARLTEADDEPLQAGWVVLAGAATEAVALQLGMTIRSSVVGLGDVSFTVVA